MLFDPAGHGTLRARRTLQATHTNGRSRPELRHLQAGTDWQKVAGGICEDVSTFLGCNFSALERAPATMLKDSRAQGLGPEQQRRQLLSIQTVSPRSANPSLAMCPVNFGSYSPIHQTARTEALLVACVDDALAAAMTSDRASFTASSSTLGHCFEFRWCRFVLALQGFRWLCVDNLGFIKVFVVVGMGKCGKTLVTPRSLVGFGMANCGKAL